MTKSLAVSRVTFLLSLVTCLFLANCISFFGSINTNNEYSYFSSNNAFVHAIPIYDASGTYAFPCFTSTTNAFTSSDNEKNNNNKEDIFYYLKLTTPGNKSENLENKHGSLLWECHNRNCTTYPNAIQVVRLMITTPYLLEDNVNFFVGILPKKENNLLKFIENHYNDNYIDFNEILPYLKHSTFYAMLPYNIFSIKLFYLPSSDQVKTVNTNGTVNLTNETDLVYNHWLDTDQLNTTNGFKISEFLFSTTFTNLGTTRTMYIPFLEKIDSYHSYNNFSTKIDLNGSDFINIPWEEEITIFSFVANDFIFEENSLLQNLPISISFLRGFTTTLQKSISITKLNENENIVKTDRVCENDPTYLITKSLIYSTATISYFFIFLALITLPLLLIYCKEQPLKSRIFVPFFGIFSIISSNIPLNYNILEIVHSSLFFIRDIISSTFYIISISLLVIQFLRYFYMRSIYSKINKDSKISKMHRIITSRLTYILFLFSIIFIASLYIIINFSILIPNYNVNGVGDDVALYTKIVLIILIFLILTCCIVIDIFVNFKSFLKQFKKFYTFNDPLAFRKELLFILPTAICFGIRVPLNLELNNYTFSEILGYHLMEVNNYKCIYAFLVIFEIFSNLFTLIFLCGWIPLFLTIKQTIQKNLKRNYKFIFLPQNYLLQNLYKKITKKEKEVQDELDKLLTNKEGHLLMEEFCRNEFSFENILLYDNLKLILNNKKRKDIYFCLNNFIKVGSENEINIPSKLRNTLIREIEKLKDEEDKLKEQTQHQQQIKEDDKTTLMIDSNNKNDHELLLDSTFIMNKELSEAFEELYNEMLINLGDTFSRLCLSNEYEELCDKWKYEEKAGLQL
ncbi:hypothetical protein ABK040_005057 [Willaertia magna]